MEYPTKIAFITGITGQDGSYLAELLLKKGYCVHGLVRRSSSENKCKLANVLGNSNLILHYGDITDSLLHLIQQIKPNEIYNLAAVSFVQDSFTSPYSVQQINSTAVIKILNDIHLLNLPCKIYQASTSEMFGNSAYPQNEQTPFHPCSPYAIAKLSAFWYICNYRAMYNMFAVNGILFNHESPRRGACFVSKKICQQIAAIKFGYITYMELGNLDAKRDWGHAKDYVYAMWLMLQQDTPEDFVISTGITRSVRDFVEEAFNYIELQITWVGNGLNETGIDQFGNIRVVCNVELFRPNEVIHLEGDSSKALAKLKWQPTISFSELVQEMIEYELLLLTNTHACDAIQ